MGALDDLSFLEGGIRLPAELTFVGSSLPELAEAFKSSYEARTDGKTVFESFGAAGEALLVIQSSLFDIKLIIS